MPSLKLVPATDSSDRFLAAFRERPENTTGNWASVGDERGKKKTKKA